MSCAYAATFRRTSGAATWPRTCTGCAMLHAGADHAWPTCPHSCASATSASRANGCCASSARNACGTTSRCDFVAQIRTVDPDATGKPFTTLEGLAACKRLPVGRPVRPHRHGDRPAARFPQLEAHAGGAGAAGMGMVVSLGVHGAVRRAAQSGEHDRLSADPRRRRRQRRPRAARLPLAPAAAAIS